MVVTSFAEVVSIGAVLPFLGIISAPEIAMENNFVSNLSDFFQVTSANELRVLITFGFILSAVIAGFLKILLLVVSTKLLFSAGIDLSVKVFKNSLTATYEDHIQNNSSDIINIVFNKCNDVIYGIMLPISTLVSASILILGVIGFLVFINPFVMITSFIAFGLVYSFILSFTSLRVKFYSKTIARESTFAIKTLQESLNGIRDVIMSKAENHFISRYKNSITKVRNAQGNNTIIGAAPRHIIETTGIVLIAGLALYLSSETQGLASAIPVLGTLAIGAQRILPSLQQCYNSITNIRSVEFPLEDVLKYIYEGKEVKLKSSLENIISFNEKITFNDVSYKYRDRSKNSLSNVSFEISKGECVGIIGTTGSGKSTLLDILMGLIEPSSGKILVDNSPLLSQDLNAWQRIIAHVPQNIYFADASIKENIAFGFDDSQIYFRGIKEASQLAQINIDIEQLDDQYDARMGENGVMLSGGQRQRLSIARALYRNSDIIIFDEATSALDVQTERNLMKAIKELQDKKTLIMVAHREETLKNCDKIIHIENGKIQSIKIIQQKLEK